MSRLRSAAALRIENLAHCYREVLIGWYWSIGGPIAEKGKTLFVRSAGGGCPNTQKTSANAASWPGPLLSAFIYGTIIRSLKLGPHSKSGDPYYNLCGGSLGPWPMATVCLLSHTWYLQISEGSHGISGDSFISRWYHKGPTQIRSQSAIFPTL